MLRTTLLVSAATSFVALVLTIASPASTPVERSGGTHMGKTAQQWHRIAVQRLKARDWYHSRLGEQIREKKKLVSVIRRMSVHDSVLTSPLEQNFLCIHSFEGSWTDPNAPYYGGMQMDLGFQETYGPEFLKAWGTADHWPASVQLAVAMKAYLTRGFGPWPQTARYCGLR